MLSFNNLPSLQSSVKKGFKMNFLNLPKFSKSLRQSKSEKEKEK